MTAPERATEGGIHGELQVLFVLFFTLPRSHPVLAHSVFRPMQQQPGLSVATGPFAKLRLQSVAEGKFFVVVVFFCHDILPSNAAVAGVVGRWFAGRDNIVVTKVRFV